MLGIGLALTAAHARSRRWSPAALFAAGQPGHWPGGYDPADRRMWSDVNGQTPALTFGAPVALALDMSRGGALGPELVVNGDFSDGANGWTLGTGWSLGGDGRPYYSGDSLSNLLTQLPWPGQNGRVYQARVVADILTTPSIHARVRVNIGGTNQDIALDGSAPLLAGQTEDFSRFGFPTSVSGATFRIGIGSNLNYQMDFAVSRVSVREALGYHPRQTVNANRPLTAVDKSVWYLDRTGGRSLPIILPAGTYGRAAVNKDGVVTIDTVVNPTDTTVVDDQRDVIFRLGAFDPTEDTHIRRWWAA